MVQFALMIIHSASQMLTLAGGPQRGTALGRLAIIPQGAVLVEGEKIAAVGTTADLLAAYPREPVLDAAGKVVMPGFVDAHTHAIWAGQRFAEFELRTRGWSESQILAAGGGVLATAGATCSASQERLMDETRPRLWSMFDYGTTTAEVKTGYGLRTAAELRLLQALLALDAEVPLELAITFLGAHAIPPLYRDSPGDYTGLIVESMLPVLKEWWQHHALYHDLPFVDVSCDSAAFDLEQSRRILTRARELGFPLKIHAGEREAAGGVTLAVELGAVSADHLVKITREEICALGASPTVAVSVPCTTFGQGGVEYTPAEEILAAGGLLALGTGLNPGSAWCESMQFVLALACRALRLTPSQAIAAATINAAAAIGRAADLGSIEPGKQADLLILNVDDYRHLGYRFGANLVQTVIKKGQIYSV